MTRIVRLSLAVALLAGLAGCGSEPDPVGSLTVSPRQIDLPHAGWQRLELAWRMSAPLAGLEGVPRVLLHLVDGSGELVRTFDHPLPDEWSPGGEATYEMPIYQSAIAPPLDPGEYSLRGGVYDTAGNRWAVQSPEVATVRVAAPGDGFPEVSFSADWLPVENGKDRQILARRWLVGDGAMRIRGIERSGSLWLRVGVPTAGELQEMRLDDGAGGQVATVRADCSDFSAELAGAGSHTLEIPLGPAEGADGAPAECRIQFGANYRLVSTVNQEERTVALENVAWRYRD